MLLSAAVASTCEAPDLHSDPLHRLGQLDKLNREEGAGGVVGLLHLAEDPLDQDHKGLSWIS